MKKGFKILFISLFVFLLAGCEKNKEVVTKCELTSNQAASGYSLDSTYEIYSKGGVVNKVKTKEVVTSDQEDVLTYFETYLNESYETASDTYGGYTYKVTKSDDKISSDVTIDYNKMDLDKFVSDNSSMKAYVNKDNKITLEGVTKIYESLGATCED